VLIFSEVIVAREIAMTKRSANRAILLLMPLVAVGFLPILAFAQGDAAGAISSARQQLITCYDLARQAEAAGANISSLTSVLNDAGDLLSQSELAYLQGDLDGAQSVAFQCSQRLSNFVSQANELRDAAVRQRSWDYWVDIEVSVVGIFFVIVAGFVVWLFLKKRFSVVEVQVDEP
jgi:hypothetical protein